MWAPYWAHTMLVVAALGTGQAPKTIVCRLTTTCPCQCVWPLVPASFIKSKTNMSSNLHEHKGTCNIGKSNGSTWHALHHRPTFLAILFAAPHAHATICERWSVVICNGLYVSTTFIIIMYAPTHSRHWIFMHQICSHKHIPYQLCANPINGIRTVSQMQLRYWVHCSVCKVPFIVRAVSVFILPQRCRILVHRPLPKIVTPPRPQSSFLLGFTNCTMAHTMGMCCMHGLCCGFCINASNYHSWNLTVQA